MSNALKHQRGFSLPETVLAMALMVLTGHRAGRLSARNGARNCPVEPDPSAVAGRVAL